MKFSGIVKKHLGRGTILGFPTANIEPPKELADGLYVGWTDGQPSLIFIGVNETFGEIERWAEVYLLNFTGDLYGQEIQVETLKKLREVIKFDSAEELVGQMKKDEEAAREFFSGFPLSRE